MELRRMNMKTSLSGGTVVVQRGEMKAAEYDGRSSFNNSNFVVKGSGGGGGESGNGSGGRRAMMMMSKSKSKSKSKSSYFSLESMALLLGLTASLLILPLILPPLPPPPLMLLLLPIFILAVLMVVAFMPSSNARDKVIVTSST